MAATHKVRRSEFTFYSKDCVFKDDRFQYECKQKHRGPVKLCMDQKHHDCLQSLLYSLPARVRIEYDGPILIMERV